MVPPGPPAPFEGSQGVPTPTFLRSNSGLLGGSGSGMSSQGAFPSMVSPRNQLSNMNMLGNMPNVSSLLQQSLANNAGPGIAQQQRVVMDNGAESDPLSVNVPNASFVSSTQNAKPNATTAFQGHQFSSPNMNLMLADLQQTNSQTDPNYFQHYQQSMNQFTASSNNQGQQQSMRAGLGGVGLIKPEPQMINDQSQQLQANNTIQSPGAVKLETQQLPSMRTLPPVKMEPQNSDSPMFSPHQQQQQQLLNASRLSPQAAAAAQILHQQRLAQIQQQQLTKTIPQQQQRGGPVQQQQQFQAQNLPTRSPVKPIYEPGMCARRLTHYMYQQQHRPEDNNIEYWKKFVAEYFAPNAKKKWCVSMYGSGRQTTGVFPQDIWNCEICLRKPGRGFEATVEVLPRLFKLKYESGTLEELLYVDMPREYQNSSGQIVLDYAKAIQESVFEQLRVVRDGQLRIVFSQDLKICSWEFCARRHEELIPKRLLIPQVNQLGSAAQKYQAAVQSAPTNISVPDMQNNCNMFIASARQLAKTMEVPLVNDLGYSKRYVRCLQISEVVNSMKDLIDFSRDSGIGPMESLTKFPRRTGSFSGFNNGPPNKQNEEQQQQHNGDDCVQGNSLNPSPSPATSAGNLLLHQNSMNSRQQQNPMNNNSVTGGGGGGGGGSYLGSSSQLPSPSSSSTTLPQQTQTTIPSPIQSPLPSSSNNPQQVVGSSSNNNSDAVIDSQSSVQKIIQGMMMTSSQLGGGGGGGMMSLNGLLPPPMTNNGLVVGNGFGGGGGSSLGFGNNGVNGIRAALRNNSSLNGRIGMTIPPPPREQSLNQQQHDMVGNQTAINGLGSVNGFNNHQFDWKASSP